ncbi:MAG: hypothetical protein A2073_00295 [Deltaproteobacteria bacterium GWC2_42_11]|nr:MAG: hypothetical protein A2073_00295 [Deltaproteobacteria bacterium GWC2_42_11]
MKIKGNLFSLISVIFILLVGIAMTGCATTPLYDATIRGDIKKVTDMLDGGADINEGYMGWTPLLTASSIGKTEIVKALLDRGADINSTTNFAYYRNWTPLIHAAYEGHVSTVKLLLERGADVEIKTKDNLIESYNKNALQLAQERGHTFIAKMIMDGMENRYGKVKETMPSITEKPTIKSDVDELPSIKAKPNKNSYAIVIGIENYRQKLPKADYAVADAKTMTEYLTKVMGYPEENVVTLTNEHAAKSDFEKYFEKWLFNNVEKDSSVFIYYSGHGAPNVKTGDAFLVPYDGDPSFIAETGYSLKRLYDNLGKLQAKEIIVALDSCFSGAGGRSVLAKGARPLVMTMESLAIPSKVAVLSASSGEQISSTYEEKGHGLFTYFMLKGIKGEGDANGDGAVEIGELFNYIKPQVERIARKVYNNEQSPQLIAPKENEKMFLRQGN